jgi:hypothetical protein
MNGHETNLFGIHDNKSTLNSKFENLFPQFNVCSSSEKRDNDFFGKYVSSLKSKYFRFVVLSSNG